MQLSGPATPPSTVTVSISRDPALVRTVRLVAAALARRTGRDEEFVEEVRLAVGEACTLLLAPSPGGAESEPLTVAMQFDDGFAVDVTCEGPAPLAGLPDTETDGLERWAMLRGLIDNFRVQHDGAMTRVSMSWPDA